MLARQQLGIKETPPRADELMLADWDKLQNRPNVRVAAALVEIGETDLADDVLKQQAKIGAGGRVCLARPADRDDSTCPRR